MGAKLFTPNVGKNFGEAFLSTIDRERKLRQDQQQFNQQMAFRNRQLGFLNGYRDSLIEQNKVQEDRLREQFEFNKEQALKPQEQKPTKQFLRSETGGGVQSDFYGYDVGTDEEDVVLDIKRRNLPDKTDKEKTPLYDLSGSGKAFKEYRELEGTTIRDETGDYDILGEKNLVSGSQVKGLKQAKLQGIIDATDNEARKITQKVPGFYGVFQEIMGARGKEIEVGGKKIVISKENIDNVVNILFKDQSSQTRDAMKTLLKRRIF